MNPTLSKFLSFLNNDVEVKILYGMKNEEGKIMYVLKGDVHYLESKGFKPLEGDTTIEYRSIKKSYGE